MNGWSSWGIYLHPMPSLFHSSYRLLTITPILYTGDYLLEISSVTLPNGMFHPMLF